MADDIPANEVHWVGLCDMCGTLHFDTTYGDPAWVWCQNSHQCYGWAYKLHPADATLAAFRLGGPDAVFEMHKQQIVSITAKVLQKKLNG